MKGVGEDWTTRSFEVNKSDYTRIVFVSGGLSFYYASDITINIVREHPEDFQVKAYIYSLIPHLENYFNNYEMVILGESEWSTTQTITVPKAAQPKGPTPTPFIYPASSPTVPELQTWIILPILIVASLLPIIFIKRRIAKK